MKRILKEFFLLETCLCSTHPKNIIKSMKMEGGKKSKLKLNRVKWITTTRKRKKNPFFFFFWCKEPKETKTKTKKTANKCWTHFGRIIFHNGMVAAILKIFCDYRMIGHVEQCIAARSQLFLWKEGDRNWERRQKRKKTAGSY